MKRLILLGTTLSFLTGCASMQQPQSVQFNSTPSYQVLSQAQLIPIMPSKNDFHLAYGNNPALARAYQQYIKTGKAPNIITDGFEQFAFDSSSQPIIGASPFELTVITLEPGENVTNVSSGDPGRWSYSMAISGQSKLKQAHIMITPKLPNISTDFVITTDKRMYTLKMVSSMGKFIKDVRFWYPEELQAFWDNYNASQNAQESFVDSTSQQPNIALNSINFDYAISCSFFNSPSWKPVRVFDDGVHTFIQFPSNISSIDLPALFIVNGSSQELVNYRFKLPYFVVDKIFKEAVLIIGVGTNQTKVTITNNHYI